LSTPYLQKIQPTNNQMDPVQEIKSRLSIIDIVSNYVELKKAGRNFKGLCPFHSEKTPSFIVSPERQFAWCFGCQNGGDIFKIVQTLEGVEFPEALKILAEKANVELPQNFAISGKKEHREKLFEINQLAAEFFQAELIKNKNAQDYLKSRGLNFDTIERWQIGFAPAGFENLFPKLLEKDFTKKELMEAGVAGLREFGGEQLFDKFRERIIFPIFNHKGKICAFTGRVLNNDMPKYLNSAESSIFQKGAILFGLNFARESIRAKKYVVITEGQLDVLSSQQNGFENVVATSGTALTDLHLKALKNLTEEIIFCFDSDVAGIESTRRALELAACEDLTTKVAILPKDFKDPDEALQKDSQIFATALKNAKTPLDFFWQNYFAQENLTEIATKKRVTRELLAYAQNFKSALEQEDFLQKLSVKLQVNKIVLTKELTNLPIVNISRPRAKAKISEREIFASEDILLGLILAFTEFEIPQKLELQNAENIKIWQEVSDGNLEKLNSERAEKLRLLAQEKYADFSESALTREVEILAQKINQKSRKQKKQDLLIKIAAAEEAGDGGRAEELLREFKEL
jgi:DNA primase